MVVIDLNLEDKLEGVVLTTEEEVNEYMAIMDKGLVAFDNAVAAYDMVSVTREDNTELVNVIVDNYNRNMVELGASHLTVESSSNITLTREGMKEGLKKAWNAIKEFFKKLWAKIKGWFVSEKKNIEDIKKKEEELDAKLGGINVPDVDADAMVKAVANAFGYKGTLGKGHVTDIMKVLYTENVDTKKYGFDVEPFIKESASAAEKYKDTLEAKGTLMYTGFTVAPNGDKAVLGVMGVAHYGGKTNKNLGLMVAVPLTVTKDNKNDIKVSKLGNGMASRLKSILSEIDKDMAEAKKIVEGLEKNKELIEDKEVLAKAKANISAMTKGISFARGIYKTSLKFMNGVLKIKEEQVKKAEK